MITLKNILIMVGVVGLVVGGMLAFRAIERNNFEAQLTELRNAVASRDQTIEVFDGGYQRLMVENKDLIDTLDKRDAQVGHLISELQKSDEKLLTANTLAIKWKRAYEGSADALGNHESPTPNRPDDPGRYVVNFTKDFGYIFVTGHTKTNPAEAYVKLEQRRPLSLTLVVSQRADKSWVTNVTSSEENMGIDVKLAAVNPHMFDQKWFEHIALSLDLAAGPDGLLGGLGVSTKIGNFDLGPKVFAVLPFTSVVSSTGPTVFYGGGVIWHPFGR